MSTNDIRPDYDSLGEEVYVAKINSPSKSKEYFDRFHKPLVERAKARVGAGNRITVLDVACGHGHEMDFLANDPEVRLVGIDRSEETIIASTRQRLKDADLIVGDVEEFPLAADFADVGMAVNAVVYKPDHMLKALFHSLKPGAECAVNVRIATNSHNAEFYQFYRDRNCTLNDLPYVVDDQQYNLKELDYRECTDESYRALDRQLYFQSTEDVARLAKQVGFEIVSQEPFRFSSPANNDNEINIFTFRKPEVKAEA